MTTLDFSLNTFSLTGKTALITGGASGLGRYYSQALSSVGANILVVSYTKTGWDETKAIVESYGQTIDFLQLDITQKDAADQITNFIKSSSQTLDILVNNAGMQKRHEWQEFPDADWDAVLDLNLNAVYHISKAMALLMSENGGGKIINIGSMQSYRAGKFIFPYTASKHGVIGLTKAYADALAVDNIQVNAIAPGYINTPMTKALQENETRNKEILQHIPAGHWADPKELMGTVVFLASNASNYITGVTLPVDGGYLLR
ncbi:SDR family oxidoreductase [Leuconostoc rapi]|uniref:SDR family oxidoreductase n=1 Tax=Leuconostoc rapi TaxID=1406906 RepID=UPI0019582190|nr:SDR family oxidoreductase [Leuconostoc rapi]MBM7435093.1 2-deoxy-D-gluconate 3-dehydrogenase [Leuconostoc rapi]